MAVDRLTGVREAFDARATSYALWPELVRGETRHRVLERLEPVADEVRVTLKARGPTTVSLATVRSARPVMTGRSLTGLTVKVNIWLLDPNALSMTVRNTVATPD